MKYTIFFLVMFSTILTQAMETKNQLRKAIASSDAIEVELILYNPSFYNAYNKNEFDNYKIIAKKAADLREPKQFKPNVHKIGVGFAMLVGSFSALMMSSPDENLNVTKAKYIAIGGGICIGLDYVKEGLVENKYKYNDALAIQKLLEKVQDILEKRQ